MTLVQTETLAQTDTLAQIEALAGQHRLAVLGGFDCDGNEDGLPAGTRSLILLGPAEPGYWAHVQQSPEWQDAAPDPIDRWSRRVIGGMACTLGGKALFPFGGAPFHPFYAWALRTGRMWQSPVRLLVHDDYGLMVSFRGALALRVSVGLAPSQRPCDSCSAPCLTACPSAALSDAGYDVSACHEFLSQPAGADCLNFGCAVRRACPLPLSRARLPEHSAYHMGIFHK